jgi:hypothetical protein
MYHVRSDVCMHVHVGMYACARGCVYACVHVGMHVRACVHASMYVHVGFAYEYVCACVNMYVACVHTYSYPKPTCTYVLSHAPMHDCIHT